MKIYFGYAIKNVFLVTWKEKVAGKKTKLSASTKIPTRKNTIRTRIRSITKRTKRIKRITKTQIKRKKEIGARRTKVRGSSGGCRQASARGWTGSRRGGTTWSTRGRRGWTMGTRRERGWQTRRKGKASEGAKCKRYLWNFIHKWRNKLK